MGFVTPMQTGQQLLPFIILISLCLTACSGPVVKAPVTDMVQPPDIWLDEHVVARGETLYSIAWRYNLDHRDLARANGISSNFRIYPGQRLSLNVRQYAARTPPVNTPPPARKTTPPRTSPAKASSTTRSNNQTASVKNNASVKATGQPVSWQWPVRGKVIASFQSNGGLNKGIDISGKLGEPVIAAASGEVVYSGNGLRGYGNLIIVKHNEKYLSAYAHNSRLVVKEGQNVEAGEQIATVGSSGTDSTKLHFEIRYDGKPVNPLNYLPN